MNIKNKRSIIISGVVTYVYGYLTIKNSSLIIEDVQKRKFLFLNLFLKGYNIIYLSFIINYFNLYCNEIAFCYEIFLQKFVYY